MLWDLRPVQKWVGIGAGRDLVEKIPPGLESEQNLVFRQAFWLGWQVSVALINSLH